MGRPLGSTNKTPRELRAESASKAKEARLKERLIKKNQQIAALKAKKAK